jgi:hypothetical protein
MKTLLKAIREGSLALGATKLNTLWLTDGTGHSLTEFISHSIRNYLKKIYPSIR